MFVKKGAGMVILFLIIGAIIGGLLGELLVSVQVLPEITPYLVKPFTIFDIPPVTIDLYIIKFMGGLALHPNLVSLLGAACAVVLCRRF